MRCPHCQKDLKLVGKRIFESDEGIRTHTLQWWMCRKCKTRYFGELIEYIFDESYEHAFYKADTAIWKKDLKALKKDPENTDFLSHYTNRIDYSYEK